MKKFWLISTVFLILTGCNTLQLNPNAPEQASNSFAPDPSQTATPLVIAPPEQPYQTADPNKPTRTPNPGIPTLTPSITMTPTETPTATLDPEDPISYLEDPWFKDNFASGVNFFLYDEPQSSFQVDDNHMILVAKKANNFETWSLASPSMYNFYLEITGTFGDECSGKDRYGMIFRARDTTEGYLISISCDGSYRLSSYESESKEYSIIVPWTRSETTNPGPGAENRLGILTSGITLTGYINGQKVFEVDDSTFGTGRFGVLVAAEITPGFTAYLSEAVYWVLK